MMPRNRTAKGPGEIWASDKVQQADEQVQNGLWHASIAAEIYTAVEMVYKVQFKPCMVQPKEARGRPKRKACVATGPRPAAHQDSSGDSYKSYVLYSDRPWVAYSAL